MSDRVDEEWISIKASRRKMKNVIMIMDDNKDRLDAMQSWFKDADPFYKWVLFAGLSFRILSSLR